MVHKLNTNKQFMIGNGILAFGVIFVVVIFVYMSLRLQRQKEEGRVYAETYTITLLRGFAGDSLSLMINDSLLLNTRMDNKPLTLEVQRFAEHCSLLIVNNETDELSLFELNEKKGSYHFERENGKIRQITAE